MRLNSRTLQVIDSPITTTYELVRHRQDDRELLNLAQAVPPYAPAPEVIAHVEEVARSGLAGAGYTEVPGLPKVREAFAAELSRDYAGTVEPGNVLVTAGCNQAFCLLASTPASAGRWWGSSAWRMARLTAMRCSSRATSLSRATPPPSLLCAMRWTTPSWT